MDNSTFGIWEVSTEGDVEGRSTRNLGIYEGHVDDIAFALADKAYYKLYFQRVKIVPIHEDSPRKRNKVEVYIDDLTSYNDLEQVRYNKVKSFFAERNNTSVRRVGTYSFTLVNGEDKYQSALKKYKEAISTLTNEEKELLGLN